jgi:MSHA biogenesis protein MshI
VDYGADPDALFEATAEAEAPRLVVELQRSFDLWDRSWPDLPLAALWVHAADGSGELATLLAVALGQRVGVLDAAEVLPGFERLPAAERAALLPMIGALWRDEPLRP